MLPWLSAEAETLLMQVQQLGLARFLIVIGLGCSEYRNVIGEAFAGRDCDVPFPFAGIGIGMQKTRSGIATNSPYRSLITNGYLNHRTVRTLDPGHELQLNYETLRQKVLKSEEEVQLAVPRQASEIGEPYRGTKPFWQPSRVVSCPGAVGGRVDGGQFWCRRWSGFGLSIRLAVVAGNQSSER